VAIIKRLSKSTHRNIIIYSFLRSNSKQFGRVATEDRDLVGVAQSRHPKDRINLAGITHVRKTYVIRKVRPQQNVAGADLGY
jgi:hypothetical protein